MSKARGWPRGWQMPVPRAVQNLQIPHPRDSQGGQLPRSAVARGGGGGRGVLGAAGIDCCIMHMAGYFEVISFLILPVFNFLILFNKKTKTKKGQLSYIMLFSRLHQAYLQSWVKPNAQTLFLDFGETAFRRVLFSRFQQANMNKGY